MDQKTYLENVERGIVQALNQQAPDGLETSQILLEGARHLSMAPGAKRARPRLTYSFGQTVGADLSDLVAVGIAGEFIHAASLLHDDVVDDGQTRRGRPTVNARWSNAVAVLGGDVMLCISIQTLAALPRVITNEAVRVVSTMSRAAILEVESRGDIGLSIPQWEAIASGKTGVLFAWCGRSAAHLVEDHDALARFDTCGEHLGLAFQLADDLKDLASTTSGKDRFADVLNRNPSFALLTAAQRSPALKAEIERLWAQPHISAEAAHEVGLRVLDTGAGEATREAIATHAALAFDTLGPYRDRPGGREVIAWAHGLVEAYMAQTDVA